MLQKKLPEEIIDRILSVTTIEDDLINMRPAFNIGSRLTTLKRDYVLRFPRACLFETLTDESPEIRQKAEEYVRSTFNELGPFRDFTPAEELVKTNTWPKYAPNDAKEPENATLRADLESVLTKATTHLNLYLSNLVERATPLIRFVHWLKYRLKKTGLELYGILLLEVMKRPVHPDCVVLELLRLMANCIDQAQLKEFYEQNERAPLQAIVAGQPDTLHRFFAVTHVFGFTADLLGLSGIGDVFRELLANNALDAIRKIIDSSGDERQRAVDLFWQFAGLVVARKELLDFFKDLAPMDDGHAELIIIEFVTRPVATSAVPFILDLIDEHGFPYQQGSFARTLSELSEGEVQLVVKCIPINGEFARDVVVKGLEKPDEIKDIVLQVMCEALTCVEDDEEFIDTTGQAVADKLVQDFESPTIAPALSALGRVIERHGAGNWGILIASELGQIPLHILGTESAGEFIIQYMKKAYEMGDWEDATDGWFDYLNDIGDEKFAAAARILSWIYRAIPEARETFLERKRLPPMVLRNWPEDLAELRELFVPPMGDEID
jgi:hypothetical protein